MDFLNNSLAQIKDLFQGMTPGSRILAGLLLAVVVVSMGFLVKGGVSGGDVYLFSNADFTFDDASAMQAAFADAGLNGAETDGGRIRVPRVDEHLYMAALIEGEALPQNIDKIMEETIGGISSYASKTLSEAHLKAAKDRKVGMTIQRHRDIARAFVHSDSATIRTRGPHRNSMTKVSVSLTPTGSKILMREDVQYLFGMIQSMYALAKLEDISITSNGVTYRGSSEDNSSNGGGHLAKKEAYEKHAEDKIYGILGGFPGMQVSVTAELDPRVRRSQQTTTPDADAVAMSIVESSSEQTVTSGAPGGNPGFTAQGGANSGGRAATAAAGGNEESTTESESQTDQIVGGEVVSEEYVGLTPTRLTASVTIPDSYLEAVWRKSNPDVEGEEPKTPDPAELQTIETQTIGEIEDIVKGQLRTGYDGIGPAPVENGDVMVMFYATLSPEPFPEPSMLEGASGWLAQSWQTLGMFGLAMFSMLMIRSMVKTIQPVDTEEGSPAVEEEEEINPEEEAKRVAAKALKPFGSSGASLKDELSDLVTDDPDAAANILKNWIGTAANVK